MQQPATLKKSFISLHRMNQKDMYPRILSLVLFLSIFSTSKANTEQGRNEKEEFIKEERLKLANSGFRKAKMLSGVEETDACISLLLPDGKFKDLLFLHEDWESLNQPTVQQQQIVGEYIEKALVRLWKIAERFRNGSMPGDHPENLRRLIFKSFAIYHQLELKRPDIGRFHASCFAMPRSGINTYFCFYDTMEKIENGELQDPVLESGRLAMMDIGYQSWTQPKRHDITDSNIVSVERFRNHVWWVGGNALAYRALFECAIMMSSSEMLDVIKDVSINALSAVSQTTYNESFWTEGLTADGAGWGHGMQCLVWGYPIHGTTAALNNLNRFLGSPWMQKISSENKKCLFNFLRGSAFLYHKGIAPPALSRYSFNYGDIDPQHIPSLAIVDNLLLHWESSFEPDELDELNQFKKEAESNNLLMLNHPDGFYHGTRYFFNNDNFAKKTDQYYSLISMASIRCDGIESFFEKADAYNIYTCDGMTLFQRTGEEYKKAMGAWNLTAPPGVTARQLDVLQPFTNWRGYTSKHNFAAGATHGGSNGVTGFIFEKLNATAKKDVNDLTGLNEKNPGIYGIKAYKSYFWFGDVFLAMGAGITDRKKDLDTPVWTVVEQTLAQGNDIHLKGTQKILHGEIKWLQNNNFAYSVIPEYTTGDIYYSIEKRSTFYDSLNVENKNIETMPEELEIFQMWIDHGNHPNNQRYAYLVNCDLGKPADVPRIIRNDSTLQAACSADGQTIEAIFYDPSERLVVDKYWFEVSSQCAFLAEIESNKIRFTVCDAQMKSDLNSITIKTNLQMKDKNISTEEDCNVINISLPGEPFRGMPASVEHILISRETALN
jgi:hypothetical protein